MKQRFSKRTRLVSALLTLAMVFTFLPFSAFAVEGVTNDDSTIELSEHNFPDKAFREYLKQFDIKKDNKLVPAERKAVTKISVINQNITTLKGIEYFRKLETLSCSDNQLTSLDVSKNTELQKLYCDGNQLTSLEVGENTVLDTLHCYNNQLTSLDVSQNSALQWLSCYKNKLTSLDVSKNTNLTLLYCDSNQLTSLDVSQNTALQELYCDSNQLTSLDVSQNNKLEKLYCSENQLTSLKLSPTAVTTLEANGNKIDINVDKTSRTFNLSTLPEFDVSKASKWVGGTVSGNTLTVDKNATQVTYTYDCGKGRNTTFTLNVNVVPDGTVTPPSGGGSTGGGSTGGGSTGGGTPGGSTGGGSTGGGSTGGGSTGGGSTGGGSTGGGSTGGSTGGGSTEAGKYQLTVTDGVATVNGITRDVLNVKPGDTVTLTADTTKFPENEEFGWWEITPYGSVSNTLTGQYQRTATFTMPNENVSARAMSKSAGVSTGGDDGGGGGAAILLVGGAAILLVGGAAVAGLVGYGVYSYVSEQQLKALLPEGVAMPENRAQTALLLWNTAGRPEPAEAPAFKDVADPDTAKAAQWCVEHGLMDQKLGGRFAPDNSDPAYKTLNAYQQLVG